MKNSAAIRGVIFLGSYSGPMRISVSANAMERLNELNISVENFGGELYCHNGDCNIEEYCWYKGPTLFECGSFSYAYSPMAMDVSVARYTSIASNVSDMGPAHPLDFVTSNPVLTDQCFVDVARVNGSQWDIVPFGRSYGKIRIGNDCWIGSNVLIKGGVTIHDGAIVASGSVVTKDVPPYAIVGGNPARTIRMRFPERIVEGFLQTKWWQHAYWDLTDLDWRNPEDFIAKLRDIKESLPIYMPKTVKFSDIPNLA